MKPKINIQNLKLVAVMSAPNFPVKSVTQDDFIRLGTIKERLSKASAGPWKQCGANEDKGGCVCGIVWSKSEDFPVLKCTNPRDVEFPSSEETFRANLNFIENCPQDIEFLLSFVDSKEAAPTSTRILDDPLTELVQLSQDIGGYDKNYNTEDLIDALNESYEQGKVCGKVEVSFELIRTALRHLRCYRAKYGTEEF